MSHHALAWPVLLRQAPGRDCEDPHTYPSAGSRRRGAVPARSRHAALTLAEEPDTFAIEHSTRLPPDCVTGGEASCAAVAGDARAARQARVIARRGMLVPPRGGSPARAPAAAA